jgi:hypothetical protein
VNSSFAPNFVATQSTPTSTASDSVSLGVVIGGVMGGILFIVLSLWLCFKFLKSYTGTIHILCFKYQVNPNQHQCTAVVGV